MIVAHFIRRFLPYSATFLRNQIIHHHEFKPIVIFHEPVVDGLAVSDILHNYPYVNLYTEQTVFEKLSYQKFRFVSSNKTKRIFQFLEQYNPDILHFHFGPDAGMYSSVLKEATVPKIVSFYGYDCSAFPKRYFGFGKYFLQSRVFPFADKILAMSNNMKKDLTDIGCPEDKIEVHYYGTETARFAFPEREYLQNETTVFLTVGRLDEKKGFFFTLEAFKTLIKRYTSNFKWRIIGNGKLLPKLKTCAASLNLEQHIEFIEKMEYGSDDLLNEFKQADIYIQPNITGKKGDKEGISGSIVEAMASGLPVISSFHAGIPEIITNIDTGWLVTEWDIEALASAMEECMSDVAKRKAFGEKASVFAHKNLNIAAKINDRERIYKSILS